MLWRITVSYLIQSCHLTSKRRRWLLEVISCLLYVISGNKRFHRPNLHQSVILRYYTPGTRIRLRWLETFNLKTFWENGIDIASLIPLIRNTLVTLATWQSVTTLWKATSAPWTATAPKRSDTVLRNNCLWLVYCKVTATIHPCSSS